MERNKGKTAIGNKTKFPPLFFCFVFFSPALRPGRYSLFNMLRFRISCSLGHINKGLIVRLFFL